jgi:intein/homing endonuclease
MEHLAIGDVLYDTDGNLIPVISIETNREPRTVYKLTLSDTSHTYFANNILTHNIKFEGGFE